MTSFKTVTHNSEENTTLDEKKPRFTDRFNETQARSLRDKKR